MLVTYLPWLMSAITIWMTLLAGNNHRHAWAVGLVNQALWLVWIVVSGAWGFLPLNAALWIVYARNHFKWAETRRGVEQQLAEMEARKDAAYLERNQVVAALAKCFPSGVARTAIEGWSPEWHGCVLIDLPTGQASWHFHDSQAHLFNGLPAYTKSWDGHSTEEKYRRLAALSGVFSCVIVGRWE